MPPLIVVVPLQVFNRVRTKRPGPACPEADPARRPVNREPTAAALLRLEKQQRAASTVLSPNNSGPNIVADLNQLIPSSEWFSTICADPPWPYNNQATRAATNSGGNGVT